MVVTSDFIHRNRYAEQLGVTPNVVKNWMTRHWERGIHYKVIGKQTFVNQREANKWLKDYGSQNPI